MDKTGGQQSSQQAWAWPVICPTDKYYLFDFKKLKLTKLLGFETQFASSKHFQLLHQKWT